MSTVNAGHLLAVDDAVQAIQQVEPMLDRKYADDFAMTIVAALVSEGWIVEPEQCQWTNGEDTASCEAWLRPGQTYCIRHL